MKTLYFDCFAGASGDMILGAMVAAGVDSDYLREQLSRLSVSGFTIDFETVNRSGLSATYAHVETAHEHKHRHLSDIKQIIKTSELSAAVKQRAVQIFTRLAEAEARVHNEPIEHVHFHEVGALDAIVDVVGAAICFDALRIDRFMCSPIHVGSGMVKMAHGQFPIPPPAVTELLKGVPFYATEIKGELLTPTGAAIITTVCSEYGPIPRMTTETNGYGAGTREYQDFPNVLRVLIGQTEDTRATDERLWMIETNLDDASPQIVGHVMDRVLESGALDCFFTAVQMKKNRPGTLLTVLCKPEDANKLTQLIFTETTTLGVRRRQEVRQTLARRWENVRTEWGDVRIKIASMNGTITNYAPEYEDCRRIAAEHHVPLKTVMQEASRQYLDKSEKK